MKPLSYTLFLAGLNRLTLASKNFSMGSGVEIKITAHHHGVEVEPSAPVPFSEKGLPAPGSGRMQRRNTTPTSPLQPRTTDVTGNWCGMYQQQYPTTGEWTEVYGEWTVPSISPRSYQSADGGPYYLYQWVGLGGDTGCGTLFQAGTGIYLDGGSLTLFTWWWFLPITDGILSDFPLAVGDTISADLTITSSDGSTGTYELINETQNYAVIVELTTDSGADAIQACGAEWILEGPGGDGTLPDFTESGFRNPHTTSNGGAYSWGPIGADVDMYMNGATVCEGYLTNDNTNDITTQNVPT